MSNEIIKTCANCKYYREILISPNDDYHIHNHCIIWGCEIPAFTMLDRSGFGIGYDDIETGKAVCWCFEQGKNIKTEFFNNEEIDYDS